MVAPGVVAKNLVTASDSSQPRVVLDEGLKDIYGQLYRVTFNGL